MQCGECVRLPVVDNILDVFLDISLKTFGLEFDPQALTNPLVTSEIVFCENQVILKGG